MDQLAAQSCGEALVPILFVPPPMDREQQPTRHACSPDVHDTLM